MPTNEMHGVPLLNHPSHLLYDEIPGGIIDHQVVQDREAGLDTVDDGPCLLAGDVTGLQESGSRGRGGD